MKSFKELTVQYTNLPHDFHRELIDFFTANPNLTPTCIEALTSYTYNQKCVTQEIVHPIGQE